MSTSVAVTATLVLTAPDASTHPTTRDGQVSATAVSATDDQLVVRTPSQSPLTHGTSSTLSTYALPRASSATVDGLYITTYASTMHTTEVGSTRITTAQLAQLNNGRLPIGVRPVNGKVPVRYVDASTLTVGLDRATQTVVSLSWQQRRQAQVTGSYGEAIPVGLPTEPASSHLSSTATAEAMSRAAATQADLGTRDDHRAWASALAILGAAAIAALGTTFLPRRPRKAAARISGLSTTSSNN